MNRKLIAIGLGLALAFLWDANAYYVHLPYPQWMFWFGVLPLALPFYIASAVYLVWKGAKS